MKANTFSKALGEVNDKYVIESVEYRRINKRNKWIKWASIVACFCLIVVGTVNTLLRFDYFKAGCSATPGTIVDNIYYFFLPHDGIYSYTPEKGSEKLLSTYWMDDWQVNDYGLYYCHDNSLYVRPHETGVKKKIFTAKASSHIRFELQSDGNVIVTLYNKHTEIISEILVDGKSGETMTNVMEPISYEQYYKSGKYSDLNYSVGNRQVQLVYTGNETTFALYEEGKNVLQNNLLVYKDSGIYFGSTLVLSGYQEDLDSANKEILVILRPDGNDEVLTVANRDYFTGSDEYIFYSYENEVWCLSLSDGSTWKLKSNDNSLIDFYSISASGSYLYSCAPWDSIHECWRIEYDNNGKPVGISLVDNSILK